MMMLGMMRTCQPLIITHNSIVLYCHHTLTHTVATAVVVVA